MSLQTVYVLPSVLDFPGVVAEVCGYPAGGPSAAEDTYSSSVVSVRVRPPASGLGGQASACSWVTQRHSSSLLLKDLQRSTTSNRATGSKSLGNAGAPGGSLLVSVCCGKLQPRGRFGSILCVAAGLPGPSNPSFCSGTSKTIIFVSPYFLGYHENGVVKAENGTSPRTKKLKSP